MWESCYKITQQFITLVIALVVRRSAWEERGSELALTPNQETMTLPSRLHSFVSSCLCAFLSVSVHVSASQNVLQHGTYRGWKAMFTQLGLIAHTSKSLWTTFDQRPIHLISTQDSHRGLVFVVELVSYRSQTIWKHRAGLISVCLIIYSGNVKHICGLAPVTMMNTSYWNHGTID